ncbi:hypothetical protein DL93DRAFT_436868 [Clavulina sp. PMI_390]|nr:hypothetical protein DL93DRAFT_436868 [Clavulina sp. PMI_390]
MDTILQNLNEILTRLGNVVRSSPAENVAPLLSLPRNQRSSTKEMALNYADSTEAAFLRVAELEGVLTDIRAEFFRQRARCRSCLVPISCLPAGVLRAIFSFVVKTSEDAHSLSLVCRSWRDVVVSQRSLWNKITFLTNGCDRLCGNSSVLFGPPTELVIRNRPDLSTDSPLTSQLGDGITKCIVHAASYNSALPADPILAFQDILEAGLPNLRLLDVVYHTEYPPPFRSSASINGVLPSLRTLRMSGLEVEWTVELPALEQLHVERVTKEKSYVEDEPDLTIEAEVQVLIIKKADTDQFIDLFTEIG